MSDWDFLHDMHDQGYSATDIADAAAVGYAPWQAKYIDDEVLGAEDVALEQQLTLMALDSLERLRQSGGVTRALYLECKAAILK